MAELLLVLWLFFCFIVFVSFFSVDMANRKQRKEKLELMEKHPHLAEEIYKDMKAEEVRLSNMKHKFIDDITGANRPKKQPPKFGSAAFRIGLGIAKRLNK